MAKAPGPATAVPDGPADPEDWLLILTGTVLAMYID